MKMKKLLSLALALALCLSLTVPAYAAGDFDIIDGVLVRYYGSGSKVVIPDGVTAIDGLTFAGCETVTSVMIPASVTKIEASAFSFADGLTSIEVDPSNPNYTSVDGVLFSRDKTLLVQYPCSKAGSSYTVPDGVTRIYGYAFYGCQNLTGISLPDSVVGIGSDAFWLTPWLESLGDSPVINGCLLEGPGQETVVIPNGITAIGGGAFYAYNRTNLGDDALKSVTLPDSVMIIGDSAFQFCHDLTNINIPDSVTDIEEQAFWDCRSLTSFTIPSGISSIKMGTFAYCSSLTSITIPSNITEIGKEAFYQSGLTSVTIPGSVKTTGESAFAVCRNLARVIISDGVKTIGNASFSGCTSLTDITIPDSVTKIEDGAFSGCKNLTDITIPSSVTEIESSAFFGCTSLTDITIPASVTKIGDRVFYDLVVIDDNYTSVLMPGLTIHGVAGSYAETYAKANNIPFVADASAALEQSPVPASPTKFTDVSPASPFVDAINWAVEKSITGGKTATTFAPGEECTRGQILTFLWRANGSPEPTVDSPFTDSIPASFQKAAVWAYEKGLVSGAAFGSATPCTRAVAVEYLWKAAGSPVTSESASFADVPANANYAQAVAWAVANGVTGGTGNGQFSSDNTCTRGQIVTFLYRAMGK